MPDVFISYSHKDGRYAHRLADELRRHSIDVWIDERIDYGDQWPRVIQDNLNASRIFLLLMSTHAFNSMWVQNEVSYAQANSKPIFPLLLEGQVWLSMSAMQYADVREGEMPPEKFIERLRSELNRPAQAGTAAKRDEARKRSKKRPALFVSISLVSLLVVAGLLYYVFDPNGKQTPPPPGKTTSAPPHETDAPPNEGVVTEPPPENGSPGEIPTTEVPAPDEVPTTEVPPPVTELTFDDFPISVGDVRTYKYGLASAREDGSLEIVQTVGDVTERIAALEEGSNEIIRIYRVERSGSPVGLDCGGWGAEGEPQTFWYITDTKQVFTACSMEERDQLVDALYAAQLIVSSTPAPELSTPAYLFPITLNAKWSRWADVPVSDDIFYVWFVDHETAEVSTYAGKFENCYGIMLRTNPDVIIKDVCKGMGLVSWFYRHFGTTEDMYGLLTSYQINGAP